MDKVYWLMFYEGGTFSNAIGNPHSNKASALMALARFRSELRQQGFTVDVIGDGITYDRYGTPCMITIEEKQYEEE